MNRIFYKWLILCIPKIAFAVIIATLVYSATSNPWLFFGSSLVITFIIFFAFSVVSQGLVQNLMKIFSYWYGWLWKKAADELSSYGDHNLGAFLIIFNICAIYLLGASIVLGLIISLIVSPLWYCIVGWKKVLS